MNFNDGLYSMYREVDELSLLNKLFTTLTSEDLNLDNYITNTTIQNKINLKDTLIEIQYTIQDGKENIKNLIKIKNGYPIYKLEDIELISLIKTQTSIEYKENQIIDKVRGEIVIILNLIKEIISKLDFNKSYESINVLANISYQLKVSQLNLSQ